MTGMIPLIHVPERSILDIIKKLLTGSLDWLTLSGSVAGLMFSCTVSLTAEKPSEEPFSGTDLEDCKLSH